MSNSKDKREQVSAYGLRRRDKQRPNPISYYVVLAAIKNYRGQDIGYVYVVPDLYMNEDEGKFSWPEDEDRCPASTVYAGEAHLRHDMQEIMIKRVCYRGVKSQYIYIYILCAYFFTKLTFFSSFNLSLAALAEALELQAVVEKSNTDMENNKRVKKVPASSTSATRRDAVRKADALLGKENFEEYRDFNELFAASDSDDDGSSAIIKPPKLTVKQKKETKSSTPVSAGAKPKTVPQAASKALKAPKSPKSPNAPKPADQMVGLRDVLKEIRNLGRKLGTVINESSEKQLVKFQALLDNKKPLVAEDENTMTLARSGFIFPLLTEEIFLKFNEELAKPEIKYAAVSSTLDYKFA